LADLPFDEAVAVADSALRDGVGRSEIEHAIARGPARRRRRAFVALDAATAEAANAFESGLRAIALAVPELTVRPQVLIGGDGFWARVDLADEENRIVLEADSFRFHGTRGALKRDAERYNELSVRGWLVLRFAWEHVMFEPDWVAGVLAAAVDTQRRRLRRSVRSRRTGANGRAAPRSA
jgi:very-short-patch-repair endonuclease